MGTVFTKGKDNSEGILSEANGQRSRDNIKIKAGSGIIAPMTVLGKITASGLFVPSPNASVVGSEGAEDAVAVNLYRVDASGASDVETVVIARDAEVNRNYLTYHTSRDNDAKKLAANVDLAAEGVIVR